MPKLKLEQVKKVIGGFTLCANFEIGEGERAALVGPSGSGKTTLLRIIAGLEQLRGKGDQGRLFLDTEMTDLPPEDRNIGMVFQDHALFPALSLIENVTFGLRVRKVAREEREAQAMPWLEKVGLKSRAHSSIQNLSGGERQRVAFLRAILWKPKLILLDEPFSALDAGLRASLRRELVELHMLWPVPLIMVTHDEADLAAVATTRLGYAEDPSTQTRKFHKLP